MKQKNLVQQSILPFEEQVEKVASCFIQPRKAQDLPVKMALGAPLTIINCERIKDDAYIFFDLNHNDIQGRPFIKGNFNDIEQLSLLAKAIGPSLDFLGVDFGTLHWTEWTTPHYKLLASMVTSEGGFAIPFDEVMIGSRGSIKSNFTEQELLDFVKIDTSYSLDSISRGYTMPSRFRFSPEDLKTPEIQEAVAPYAQLQPYKHLPLGEFKQKVREFGLSDLGCIPIKRLCDEDDLREIFAEKIAKKRAMTIIEENLYYPHCYAVLSQFFNEVEVKRNVPYPVPFGDQTTDVIYAKNPKR